MSESNINVTPGSGGPNIDLEIIDNGNARQVVCIGDSAAGLNVAPVDSVKGLKTIAYQIPADQIVSTVGASAAAVTATLPAVTGQYHYIVGIHLTRYATVLNTASATPITITTTNLPGSLAWTIENGAMALGTVVDRVIMPAAPLKSSVPGTATTIVAPASAGVLWRINVEYYIAP